jgi:peptide/nickel transport system permease protein
MKKLWQRYCERKTSVVGMVLLVLITVVALIAPWIAPHQPWDIVGTPFLPPFEDSAHLLGTDTLGRDIFSGIVHGTRISLTIGLVCMIATVILGLALGAVAGYYGKWIDDVLMRSTEFFQVLPNFVFVVVLVAIFRPSIGSIFLAIVIVSWPPVARLVRSEFLSLRSREFVEAAVAVGHTNRWIIFKEILPNALSPIVAMSSLMVASSILLESAVSFLGLGDPNLMTWGYMIGTGRTVIRGAWWMSVLPGVALVSTILIINVVGEGLGRAWNPRLSNGAAR